MPGHAEGLTMSACASGRLPACEESPRRDAASLEGSERVLPSGGGSCCSLPLSASSSSPACRQSS